MPAGTECESPRNWIVEIIAVVAIVPLVGVWIYQTLTPGTVEIEVRFLFVAIVMTAVVFLFGIDRVRAALAQTAEHYRLFR